jgi:hypothetical protein
LIVEVGSTTQSTLRFEDVVVLFLLKEMRRKSMEGVAKDVFLYKRSSIGDEKCVFRRHV